MIFYFAKPSEPQPVDFDNLPNMASASDEDPGALSSLNLFCKDAFVVIKPGYQPSRLPGAHFFLSKCKNNVKTSGRKLTVSIYAQDQLLSLNFVDTQLQCQTEISGILRNAENVRIEDDVVALDEDEYSSCVIDCLDYGDQTRAGESAEIGDVSDEREKHLMKSFKCDPQRQQCKPHGLDEHRDLEINHYTCYTTDSQISTLRPS